MVKRIFFIQKDINTDWFLINTPFLGALNDTIEICAQKSGSQLRLSVNGETMSNLASRITNPRL
jgi:hypothetical protein